MNNLKLVTASKNECEFLDTNDNSVHFLDGTLSTSTYSYEIASVGCVDLTEEQTYQLYLSMKSYFENKNNNKK